MKKTKKEYIIVGKLPNSDEEKVLMTRCEFVKITDKTLAHRLRRDLEAEYSCNHCRVVEVFK